MPDDVAGGGAPRLIVEVDRRGDVVVLLDVPLEGPLDDAGTARTPPGGHGFAAGLRWSRGGAEPEGRRLELDIRHTGERPVAATVRLRLELPGTRDPWWLMPGLFYGENRPAGSDQHYPRFAVDPQDPMASLRWEFRADRAATPAAFVWGERSGAALVTLQDSVVGLTGLGLGQEDDRASVWLSFPFRETPVAYDGSDVPRAPVLAGHVWQPGERATLQAAVHLLGADRHGYAPVLRAVAERAREAGPVEPWVAVPEAADIAAEGLLRWHYDPDPGVLLETVGFDRGVVGQDGKVVDRQAMHVGWVSGVPWAYALLVHGLRTGAPAEVAAARRVIDVVCGELSPSGTFWGVWYREHGWRQSWGPLAQGLHARTLGEATLFLLRALALPTAAAGTPARWVVAARSNLDTLTRRQRADGNLGAVHHALTGEVLSWAGAAGLTWVAALAEAQALDDDGRYLAAAVRAGEYYARFVTAELINGAPEDVGLAPTSEDGYAAVIAYVALHRRTGEQRWLDLARRAADWMLTFRYTYDVTFGPRTLLGAYRFSTRGGDQASPANQHLHAYGLVCTAELLDLSAALGDGYYRQRALETLACFRQLLAVQDGDVNAYRGMVTERYYQTECFQPKGMVLTLSHAWSVGVLLLGCEQAIARGVDG